MATHGRESLKKNYAPAGMFEVTKQIKNISELDVWVKRFQNKGIATAIATTDSGAFILCREGVESKL